MKHFLTRPSKSFLFDYLDDLLKEECGDIGVDAAAERLRNRHMFRTKHYIGIDRDQHALERGLKSTLGDDVYALLGDLTDLTKIPEGSADVVLSSNTLYQIRPSLRGRAVKELARITAPQGVCIVELTKDEDFPAMLALLTERFKDVQIIYFKNPLSRAYERLAYDKKSKERLLFVTKPFRLLAWLISRCEYLTMKSPALNTHVVVIARGKMGGAKTILNVTSFEKRGERLYSILQEGPSPMVS